MNTKTVAVLSDTHSNAQATCAAFQHAGEAGADAFWFLGDAVGRGPSPVQTLNCLRNIWLQLEEEDRAAWLKGNHDAIVVGDLYATMIGDQSLGPNNHAATQTDFHNRDVLRNSQNGQTLLDFLRKLPSYAIPREGVFVAHAAYYFDTQGTVNETQALTHSVKTDKEVTHLFQNIFQYAHPRLVLNGHTHYAGLWQWDPEQNVAVRLPTDQTLTFEGLSKRPVYINPGSVGFPRGGTWPSYVLLTFSDDPDVLTVTFRRFVFDVQKVLNALPHHYPSVFQDELKRIARLFNHHEG